MPEIIVEALDREPKPLVAPEKLGFGKVFTDRIFTARWRKGEGWSDYRIQPCENLSLGPAASVLHYGVEIFEGLKAYASDDDRILLFRPEQNARRMMRSAARMCLPEFPEDDFLSALESLVVLEKRWIPQGAGASLYIRPTMIATENFLGVHTPGEALFYILLSPSGPYFASGFKPVNLWVEDQYVRAVVGGVGDAKTGGNYAASMLAAQKANERGYSQVLWLDGRERKWVEEGGAMNIFFVFGNKLVTPALQGSILPGITRASIVQLAPTLGIEAEERPISIDEVVDGLKSGSLTECFSAGTAAVVGPVGGLHYKGVDYKVGSGEPGAVTTKLYETLTGIQWGRIPDPFGWVREIGRL